MPDDLYDQTIRDVLPIDRIIGATILDVTQHDRTEYTVDGRTYIQFHLSTGVTIDVTITEATPLSVLDIDSPDDDPTEIIPRA